MEYLMLLLALIIIVFLLFVISVLIVAINEACKIVAQKLKQEYTILIKHE